MPSTARHLIERLARRELGQVAVMFVLLAGVAGFAGVLAVDVGLLLTDRRDAQGDADAIALAAAQELPQFNDELASGNQSEAKALAFAVAEDWAEANGVSLGDSGVYSDPDSELSLTALWNDDCFAGATPSQQAYTGIEATVTRTARSIFLGMISDIVDVTEFSVSATACTGVPVEAKGFMPWVMSMSGNCFSGGEPLYGRRCILLNAAGNEDDASSSSNIGQISIDPDATDCPADSSNSTPDYKRNIAQGVQFVCGVDDSLSSNPGLSPLATIDAIRDRLLTIGSPCDDVYGGVKNDLDAAAQAFVNASFAPLPDQDVRDGVDDFFEIWGLPPAFDSSEPATDLQLFDCDPGASGIQSSPRNIAVFLISAVGASDAEATCGTANPGNNCYLIKGLAAVYLEGCSTDGGVTIFKHFNANPPDVVNPCPPPYGQLQIYGRLVSQISLTPLKIGYSTFGDWQTFLKE